MAIGMTNLLYTIDDPFEDYIFIEGINTNGRSITNLLTVPSNDTGIEFDFFAIEPSGAAFYLGGKGKVGTLSTYFGIGWSKNTPISRSYAMYFGTSPGYRTIQKLEQGKRIIASVNRYNSKKYIFGEESAEITTVLASNTTPLALGDFANGNFTTEGYYLNGVYFNVRITEGTILDKSLKPTKRKSDNMVGLLDIINNRFYVSTTAYPFTEFNSTQSLLDLGVTPAETLDERLQQLIDLGVI